MQQLPSPRHSRIYIPAKKTRNLHISSVKWRKKTNTSPLNCATVRSGSFVPRIRCICLPPLWTSQRRTHKHTVFEFLLQPARAYKRRVYSQRPFLSKTRRKVGRLGARLRESGSVAPEPEGWKDRMDAFRLGRTFPLAPLCLCSTEIMDFRRCTLARRLE